MSKPGPDQRVSDKEILQEIALSPDPVVTAPELADRLDYSRQAINRILNRLTEEGLISEREVGARAKIYWLTDEGQKAAAQSD